MKKGDKYEKWCYDCGRPRTFTVLHVVDCGRYWLADMACVRCGWHASFVWQEGCNPDEYWGKKAYKRGQR